MRIFQNSGIYRSYRPRLERLTQKANTFSQFQHEVIKDRFGASHLLKPIIAKEPEGFFTNGDDPTMQKLWSRENGLPPKSTLEEILLAQIEEHRTEVFYNLDPVRYPSEFVKKLPGCVKHSIAWRAAPSGKADLSQYNLVVSNFPSILETYRQKGWTTKYFTPSYDPELDSYAENEDRPVDVIFIGGYSRHHNNRAVVLETVARECSDLKVKFLLDQSRANRLAESPLGQLLPLKRHRRPLAIRQVSSSPAFGRDLYSNLSKSKIVLNGAIDMAGNDRGNMRCFEALGSGALLISDEGNYPKGFVEGETMITYKSKEDVVGKIFDIINNDSQRASIARRGHKMVSTFYSKERQWERFLNLIA